MWWSSLLRFTNERELTIALTITYSPRRSHILAFASPAHPGPLTTIRPRCFFAPVSVVSRPL